MLLEHRGSKAVTWQSLGTTHPPSLVRVEGEMEGGRLQTLVLPQAGVQCPLHPFLPSKWHWETTHQGSLEVLQHGDVVYLVWGSSAPSQCPMGDARMMKDLVWF